jgi:hypothetical protein
VKFLEVVDTMIGHILAILAAAEQRTHHQHMQQDQPGYAICVTGDHSTPVVFGDHSHEPVPFALAWVRDAVAARGGLQQLEEEVKPGKKIPVPDTKKPPPLQELLQQAEVQAGLRREREGAFLAEAKQQQQQQQQQQHEEEAEEKVAPILLRQGSEGEGVVTGLEDEQQQEQGRAGTGGGPPAATAGAAAAGAAGGAAAGGVAAAAAGGAAAPPAAAAVEVVAGAASGGASKGTRQLLCEDVLWDGVVHFDELSAARGVLGRFPGSGLMPLIKQLLRQGPQGP